MTTITFDTLKVSRNLKAAGFAEAQADAIIDTVAEAFNETVATKADITEVKTEIAEVKADLKADIAEVKAEIINLETRMDARLARLESAAWKAGLFLVGGVAALIKLLDWLIR